MKKKTIFGIMFILMIQLVLAADICEDRLTPGQSCIMLTPVLDCSGNYTIYTKDGVVVQNSNMTLLNDSIYYFIFNQVEGDYIVKLCDNSTREIIVGGESEMIEFLIFLMVIGFVFLGLQIWMEGILFGIISGIIFVINGLILITTEIIGVDTKFTIGIGVILVLVGIFVGIFSYKSG